MELKKNQHELWIQEGYTYELLVKNFKEWKKEQKNEFQQNIEMRNKFVQWC